MGEEHKKEECCGPKAESGCGCCCGAKKVLIGVVLALLIFTCGYIFGKGACPFKCFSSQTCPLMKN